MACRSGFRTVLLTEQWMHFPLLPFTAKQSTNFVPICRASAEILTAKSNLGYRLWANHTSYCSVRNCSNSGSVLPFNDDSEQEPPQEAVLKAISEVSKTEGRVGQTTNVIIGGTVTDDSTKEWLALDQKVNSYPTIRGFTAIGTGGDDFVNAMVVAVESVLQKPIPEGQVRQKISSGGKYVSVNIGPVQVVSSEQVQAIYNAMRRDDRMKYFL